MRISSTKRVHRHATNYKYTATKKTGSIWGQGFNGRIGSTCQGKEGDCWLLSGINSLNSTSWGRQALQNSIRPYGNGVIITLKGAETSRKEFYISQADIKRAKATGKYSKGDNDMIAYEIAIKAYKQLLIKEGKLHKKYNKAIDGGRTEDAQNLITGKKPEYYYSEQSDTTRILRNAAANPNKYALTCDFKHTKYGVHDDHAYQVKRIFKNSKGVTMVELVNPWDSSKVQYMSYKNFRKNLNTLSVAGTKTPSKMERIGNRIKHVCCRFTRLITNLF